MLSISSFHLWLSICCDRWTEYQRNDSLILLHCLLVGACVPWLGWCVSRQMELTPAVISGLKVLWWRGRVAPEAGDISLQQGLSSHWWLWALIMVRKLLGWGDPAWFWGGSCDPQDKEDKQAVVHGSMRESFWHLVIDFLKSPVVFFLTALSIDYLVFITWMQLKMLLWKILPVQTYPMKKEWGFIFMHIIGGITTCFKSPFNLWKLMCVFS